MKERGKKFSLSERLESFRYAYSGIIALIRFEHNFRIHLIILTAVILAAIFFRISLTEWMAILFVSSLVLVSESFNSAIEYLSDAVSPGKDERIGKAKDIAAAAVLISAITAIIAGLLIFIPELLKLFA
jgi:diacylglycerol kinase (ATP)